MVKMSFVGGFLRGVYLVIVFAYLYFFWRQGKAVLRSSDAAPYCKHMFDPHMGPSILTMVLASVLAMRRTCYIFYHVITENRMFKPILLSFILTAVHGSVPALSCINTMYFNMYSQKTECFKLFLCV